MRKVLEIYGKYKPVTLKNKTREVTCYYGGTHYSAGPRFEVRLNGAHCCDLGMNNGHLLLIPGIVREYFNQHCKKSISLSWGKNTVSIDKQVNETDLFIDKKYGCGASRETIKMIGECAKRFIDLNLRNSHTFKMEA